MEHQDIWKKAAGFVRRYPLGLLCVALIWYLSLWVTVPETPLDDVAFVDKWTHLVMYGGTCAVVWCEHLRSHARPRWGRLLLLAVAGMVVMGGAIELLQEYTTADRSGEWLDFAADTVGVVAGAVVGLAVWRWRRA